MDETTQTPDGLRQARRALSLLQMHAGHERIVEKARAKMATDVRARLERQGVSTKEGEAWPALAAATGIMTGLSPELRGQVLSRLPEALRQEVVERLYSFASIRQQADRSVQRLLASVDRRTLATALIGADSATRAAVIRNMSRRAATMLEEDIDSLVQAGELTTRDVRDARETVGHALFRLYESGEIGR